MFAEKESGWESECGWARKPRDENPSSRDVMPARVIKLKSFVSGVVHRERGGGREGRRERERERERERGRIHQGEQADIRDRHKTFVQHASSSRAPVQFCGLFASCVTCKRTTPDQRNDIHYFVCSLNPPRQISDRVSATRRRYR